MDKDVMDIVIGIHTANEVWSKLKTLYGAAPTTTTNITTRTKDQAEYLALYRATLNGEWEQAQYFFNKDKDTLMAKLNDDNDTPLHVAIGTCKNIKFVENLLKEITPESLPNLVTTRKSNPLHYAAFVGNTMAAEMLVNKNPKLLFIADKGKCFPINRAILSSHTETFRYLLKATKDHIGLSEHEGCQTPFTSKQSATLLHGAIRADLWDAAHELIKENPGMATTKKDNSNPILKSIAGKLDAYLSGKGYNFYQRFISSHVPVELGDLYKRPVIQDIENQETDKANFAAKYRRSWFHPVIQRISVGFWKVALRYDTGCLSLLSRATGVPHIQQLKEDKVKHIKVLSLLKCICEEVSKINKFSEIREHYLEAITMAVEHDNPEAVEEIIRFFPQAISTKDNDYPLIQLAIINRCERVYNFFVHKVTTDKHSHKVRVDEYGNNLLHLAGHLAPIHKLNLVSGAALQMQRELQWFEVNKLFLH
ncbi:hypothetical protein L2E82_31039 [Cichorium intybus]|uniref:Uncharacterized protein n=1 Tax=Cichorium intybus TaxID=13427 RepID=A0ACB9D276_CICIN|nr:hypothetical protein L2E82_31039 [Cichorium intybus]